MCRRPAAAIPLPDRSTQANGRTLRTVVERVARKSPASPWQQLESTDLAVYAANLRTAGCSPKTVRDILLPWLEEEFEHTETLVSEPTNFWASFSQREAAAAARVEQENVLEKKKSKTIQEVLGFAWTSDGLKQAYAGEAAGPVGFLDYDRAEMFLCTADRFNQKFSRADRLKDRAAIYQEWLQEVGEVLTPAEFEETQLRGILMICQRRNPNLCHAGLSGSELRQLMAFRRELCNPLPSALLAGGDELLQEPDSDREQHFQAKARALLGESRFIDYLKSCDPIIEKTLAVLEQEHLPRSLALELFDLREEAIARAQKIRQLPVRRAEKRTQLTALRQSAIEQLATLPNAATDSPRLESNQEWIPGIVVFGASFNNPLLEINRDWLQEIANP